MMNTKRDRIRFKKLIHEVLEQAFAGNCLIARQEVEKAKKYVTVSGDKSFLKAIEKSIDGYEMLGEDLGVKKMLPLWKESLNLLRQSKELPRSRIDNATIDSEIVRLHVQLDLLSYSREGAAKVIDKIRELCEKYPNDYTNFYRLGYVLQLLREYGEARRALLRGRGLNPNSARPYYHLAHTYMQEGEFSKALACYEVSLKLLPENNPSMNNIGIAYYQLGFYNKALRKFEEAMEKTGPDPFFSNNQAFLLFRRYLRLGGEKEVLKHAEEIANLYRTAILEKGANATAHFNLAFILYLAQKQRIIVKTKVKEPPPLMHFKKTKKYYMRDQDKMGSMVCSYFIERCKGRKAATPHDQLLENLLWDVSNFISEGTDIQYLHQAFLKTSRNPSSHLSPNHLMILKRWLPRFSPCTPDLRAGGGGYFLRWENSGIVINPGINFLSNFRNCGYTIPDIDVIILTCNDPGETIELEPILILMKEMNKQINGSHEVSEKLKVKLIMDFSSFQKFSNMLSKFKFIEVPEVMIPRKVNKVNNNIEIFPFELYKKDGLSEAHKESTGLGLILKFYKSSSSKPIKIGFIGQTTFHEDLVGKVNDLDVLIVSVGCIKFKELLAGTSAIPFLDELEKAIKVSPSEYLSSLGFQDWDEFAKLKDILTQKTRGKRDKNIFYPPNNLGFTGANKIITKAESGIVILTDLAQELGHLRHTVAEVLDRQVNKTRVLTGDIGLRVSLENHKVLCEFDQTEVDKNMIAEVPSGMWTKSVRHICTKHRKHPKFEDFITLPI